MYEEYGLIYFCIEKILLMCVTVNREKYIIYFCTEKILLMCVTVNREKNHLGEATNT